MATVRGVEYAYREQGSGAVVLLVHGFPLDHSMWSNQIAALAGRFRVITPDLRGFGATPLGEDDAAAKRAADDGISMQSYADDLAALLDAIGVDVPIVLAGFSMGGYIAWQFWRKYALRLKGLILCDTRAAADTNQASAGRVSMADEVADWPSGKLADVMIPKLFAADSIAHTIDVVEQVRSVITATNPQAVAAAQRGMAHRIDVTEWLPQINLPTLQMAGDQDEISRAEEMQQMSKAMPDSTFAVIPRAGHMAPVENPDAVNAHMLHFLEGIPS